ncbi:MAG: DUF6518 family protein [Propionibacteriaceae bacterium]|nr:DUF6518 family protein [Propionibacteriaceae bacterium]
MERIGGDVVGMGDVDTLPLPAERRRGSHRRGWYMVIAAALGLAIVSWVTNITTEAQLAGQADGFLGVRSTFSKLANSGTAWAGLGIACGWLVRRPLPAAAAGIVGSLLSLVAHYVFGRLSGMFTANIWAENLEWFVAAIIFGGPLGLIGALARRPGAWGLAARLVVPLGAVLEPFVVGMFALHPMMSAPQHLSSMATAITLIIGGVAMGAAVLVDATKPRREFH